MRVFTGDISALPEPCQGWEGGARLDEDVCAATARGLVQIAAAGVPYHPDFVAALRPESKGAKTPPKNKGGKTPPENKGSK